jgi:hypothetical protein
MGRSRAAVPAAETGNPKRAGERRGLAAIVGSEFWDPRLCRRRCLDAMSRAFDAWLRSAAFLEFMQQGLKTAIVARQLYGRWAPSPATAPGAGVRAGCFDIHSGERK